MIFLVCAIHTLTTFWTPGKSWSPFSFVSILIVNDGSTKKKHLSINKIIYLKKVEILNLKNNVKAQIAIATGLGYLRREKFDGGIIVMDGDGQDDPNQLIDLINMSCSETRVYCYI